MADVLIPNLPRCHFDKSKKRIGSMKAGVLYPLYSKVASPGETLNINIKAVVRRLPTISPSFAEDKLIFRAFKVPIRTLWKDWKSWLMGVKEYSDNIPYEGDVPRWTPSNINKTGPKSLWKMLGYPTNTLPTTPPADFKRQAYGWIRDIYFRYRPVQDTALREGQPGTWEGEDLFIVNKDRDYFTTGLTQQQVGEAVSLPITGDTSAVFDWVQEIEGSEDWRIANSTGVLYNQDNKTAYIINATSNGQGITLQSGSPNTNTGRLGIQEPLIEGHKTGDRLHSDTFTTKDGRYGYKFAGKPEGTSLVADAILRLMNENKVSLNNISSATIAMIRHAFARQVQAENLARLGAFYPDVLRINFGEAPSDDILGYPIYCGGFQMNIINSEVLQTAPSDTMTPLGDMGGHGLGVGTTGEINIHSDEHSIVMVIGYIKSENFYGGQQLPKEDMFISNDDMLWIAYQHLSEQPVKKQELCCISKQYPWIDGNGEKHWGNEDPTAEEYNEDTLFYMPYGQWAREDVNDVFGLMVKEILYQNAEGTGDLKEKNNLYHWTKAQFYSIKDGERPAFNDDFISYKEDFRDYAVQYEDIDGKINEDQYITWFNFIVDSYQVLDENGTPGELDHLGRLA